MSLITGEELARGLLIGIFGGAAGVCTVAFPGSVLWLLPASIAVGGCALTVPEVRQEVVRSMPALPAPAKLRALPDLMRRPSAALSRLSGPTPKPSPLTDSAQPPSTNDNLIETLANTPHRLIIGHTRGGKTTLIHHMATMWAAHGERVLVGDPDAAPGLWPGCEVRGHGDDIQAIGELLNIVQTEVTQRRAARAQGVRQFAPLHLIIDEAQDVLPALDGGLELFEDVARRGGKLNIRMTVGVQDKQVRTLGLEGKSELLRNFQVADVLKNHEGQRVAVLRDAESGKRISMPIPQLRDPETMIRTPSPARPDVPARASEGATMRLNPAQARQPVSKGEAAALLSSLFPEAIPPRQDTEIRPTENRVITSTDTDNTSHIRVNTSAGGGVTVNVAQMAGSSRRTTRARGLDMKARHQRTSRYAQVRALVAGNARFEDVYRAVKGNRNAVHAEFKRAKAELGK